jgi:hypothetical protein
LQPQPHRKRAKEYIKSNVETFELADTAKWATTICWRPMIFKQCSMHNDELFIHYLYTADDLTKQTETNREYQRAFLLVAVFIYGLSTHSLAASGWLISPSDIWNIFI